MGTTASATFSALCLFKLIQRSVLPPVSTQSMKRPDLASISCFERGKSIDFKFFFDEVENFLILNTPISPHFNSFYF